jgi:sulfur carrier protein ThiS
MSPADTTAGIASAMALLGIAGDPLVIVRDQHPVARQRAERRELRGADVVVAVEAHAGAAVVRAGDHR